MRHRTLLGLWAHPDDEAYLSAGLMYEHACRGDRVLVVTATAGEHGTSDPESWPPARLSALRRDELTASLSALGVTDHQFLGYEDGRCHEIDGTYAFVDQIETADPDVIVTFGPDGMTGHPDHQAVSKWATTAWERTGRRAELWYATLTPDFHRRWGKLNEQLGIFADQPNPPCTPEHELAHIVRLSGEALEAKFAALAAQRSQTAPLIEMVGDAVYRQWWSTEAFRAAGEHHQSQQRQKGWPAGSR